MKYSSVLIAKTINYIMSAGKKTIARDIVYGAIEKAGQKTGMTGLEVLEKAIDNAGPQVELKSKRVGGANYQVPHEVSNERRITLALRWIINAARSIKGRAMEEKLAEEIVNAANNTGNAVKKKQDIHRMAEANKAFAHFAW